MLKRLRVDRFRPIRISGKFTRVMKTLALKESYVKARYSKHYRITKDELEWLSAQVEELGARGPCDVFGEDR